MLAGEARNAQGLGTGCLASQIRKLITRRFVMTAPDWLMQRGGELKLGSDGKTWFVLLAGRPNYSLVAVPVAGKFGCTIRQTINGQRIECGGTFATVEEAIGGGLEALRQALGWG
jgi:hypothetical protein